jgi:hypothetical protein
MCGTIRTIRSETFYTRNSSNVKLWFYWPRCMELNRVSWKRQSHTGYRGECFQWGKGGHCVGQTTLTPSRANCQEIWAPQPPGSLGAFPGLYRGSFSLWWIQEWKLLREMHLALAHTQRKYNNDLNVFCQMELETTGIIGDKTSKEWRQVQENLPYLPTLEEEENETDHVKGGNEAGVARGA